MKIILLVITCMQIWEAFKYNKGRETKQLGKLVQAVILMNVIARM